MHAILLLAASLAGQCLTAPCQAPYVARQNYVQTQAYVQKQAYAVAAYGQAYNYNQYHYVAPVAVSPAYFAEATAAYIRAKAAATVQAQSDREVAARLDRIEAKIPAVPPPPDPGIGNPIGVFDNTTGKFTAAPGYTGPTPNPPPPTSAVEPSPPPPPTPALTPSPVAPPRSLATVLERNQCAKCHTGESSSKGFKLFEDDGRLVLLDIKAKQKVYLRTDATKPKSMPPRGDRVSLEDRKVIADALQADVDAARQAVSAIEESIKN